jgi:hypothetical protein
MLAAALVLASTCLAQTAHRAPQVSTPAPIYSTPAESNGRLWVSRPIIGGLDTNSWERGERDAKAWDAASFGAFGEQHNAATVAIDGLFDFEAGRIVTVNPWSTLLAPDKDRKNPYGNDYKNARNQLRKQIESARIDWLREHNYTGGVRTFVNDEQIWHPEKRMGGLPEPRAIIEYPPDQPRFKSRMQVRANDTVPFKVVDAATNPTFAAKNNDSITTNTTMIAGPGRGRVGVPGKSSPVGGAWTPNRNRVTKVIPAANPSTNQTNTSTPANAVQTGPIAQR